MGQFETDYYSKVSETKVRNDIALAQKVGTRGTPNFFINGVKITGAQPFEKFAEIIDEQLNIAKKIKRKKKLRGEKLYKAAVEYNKKNTPDNSDAVRGRKKWAPKFFKKLNAPWKGKKRAKVVVYIVSDFQCPYCSRAAKTIKQLESEYGDRIRFNFVNFPLEFHKNAAIAHLAAIAASRQGKFWEMHDRIFALQKTKTKITQDVLDAIAKDIGLNMKRYHRDRKSKKTRAKLKKDIEIAKKRALLQHPFFRSMEKNSWALGPLRSFERRLMKPLKRKK